jgi:Leucine-rich repeat (LRR) protein
MVALRTLYTRNFGELSKLTSIPKQILNLFLPIHLNLAKNSLSGLLTFESGNLKSLVELDISNNLLFGEIPKSLGNCLTLERLYMHNNFFDGNIPPSLSNLASLQVLDLSHNNLIGISLYTLRIFPFCII